MKLLLLLALPLSAAVTNVSVETLSMQVLLHYTAPDSGRCTLAVSTAAGLSPVIPQFDTSKFGASANSDSNFSYLDSGKNRNVIIGQKAAVRGTLDGISYSLALAEATSYYLQITCGASVSTLQTFSTRSAPLGLMYIDPVQADATNPGEMLSPAINFAARQFYTDPQTGISFQPITLPHDITGWGLACCGPHAPTNAAVTKSGAGWSGSNFPYTVTADATSGLVFEAAGLIGWPTYPFDEHAASYSADVGGNLNWAQWVVVGHSSNAGCPGLGAQCTISMCMSENDVSCDPWSPVYTCILGSTNTTCTFGTLSTLNQGGWASPVHRFRNGPETADRNSTLGNITCNGSTTVVLPSGQPTNPLWVSGTPLTINGTGYLISSITNESTMVLQSSCAAGAYPYNISTLSWIVKASSSSADTLTVSSATSQWEFGFMPEWPDAGYWGTNSQNLVNGASSYLFQTTPGQGVYATNATTGATVLIGPTVFNGNGQCTPSSASFDVRTNVTIQYCLYQNQLWSFTYSPTIWADLGNLDAPNQLSCSFNTPPCWTQVNMTSGTSLDALASAFDPSYLGSSKGISCSNVNPSSMAGINQLNHLVILCWAGNSTRGYLQIFDPLALTNTQPGNAGCISALLHNSNPGCVIAQTATFLTAPSRGQAMKGDVRPDAGPGIVMWQPQPNAGSLNGQGPWQVNMTGSLTNTPTTCPANAFGITGANCTLITVSGEPYDPTPGPNETGLPGEYITAQPGDYLTLTAPFAVGLAPAEALRILVKNSSTQWWVQRGVTRGFSFCTPPAASATCGFGGPPAASGANPIIYYNVTSGEMMWNYITDPKGESVQQYNYDSIAHRATQNGMDLDSSSINGGTGSNWPPCIWSSFANGGCFGIRIAATTPALLTQTAPLFNGSTPLFPQFNGTASVAGGNNVQFHPSVAGPTGSADSLRYGNDARPFNGLYAAGGQPCSATNVTGTLWKTANGCYAATVTGGLHRKIFPTKAQWGWHPLLDSSPTAPSLYQYCVPVNANECRSGSVAGEIYFNVPWLSTPYCFFAGQAGQGADVSDICIMDNNPMLDTLIEMPMDNPSDRGDRQRIISHMFAPSKVNAPFGTLNSLPNNKWWAAKTRMFGTVRSEALLFRRSVEEQDSIDRTNYQTPGITIPAGAGYAQVEWGYLESGSDGSAKFYCTSRADNCRSKASPSLSAPFSFVSETQTPTTCSSGCTVTPSFIGDRVVLYRILRTDVSGNVTARGQAQAMAVR